MMNDFKFQKETGVIIDDHNSALAVIDGSMGAVEFPPEFIWQLHRARPGVVFELAHTHPPGMNDLSARDRKTLKTWTFALYPFPARLSVTTWIKERRVFEYKRFLGLLEPREQWVDRGKGQRGFEIINELNVDYYEADFDDYQYWPGFLLKRSYDKIS